MKKFISSSKTGNPLIYGEVLFDIFTDASVLGGAPFNVAWNLQGLSMRPLFISRVGRDDKGQQIVNYMKEWEMDTQGVQFDHSHPTGMVEVTLHNGQPKFMIVPQQAYDYIERQKALSLAQEGDFSLLYRGTLAARTPESRQVIEDISSELKLPIFLDVNLRPPWWDRESAIDALYQAQWAKLNSDELGEILNKKEIEKDELEETALEACAHFKLEFIVITLGGEGALLITEKGEVLREKAEIPGEIQDTVGAGDAFSSIIILGLCRKWPIKVIFERALNFASHVCLLRGATTFDREFYHKHIRQWEDVYEG